MYPGCSSVRRSSPKAEERADLERVLAADTLLDAGHTLVQRFRAALHDLDVTASSNGCSTLHPVS